MGKEQPPAYNGVTEPAPTHSAEPQHDSIQPAPANYGEPQQNPIQPIPASYGETIDGSKQPIQMQPGMQNGMDPNSGHVVPLQHLGPQPEWIDCQFCKQRTKTDVVKKGTALQVLTGAALCFLCICLTPLPCMLHWFEETQWWCTNCKNMVAHRGHDAPTMVMPAPEERVAPSQFAGKVPV